MTQSAPIAVALDAPDLETAARWAALVTPHVSTVKVGLELYLRYGPEVVASIRGASGVKIFLDLKLHDIPATVGRAVTALAGLGVELLTVHAGGGRAMLRAAVEAAGGRTRVTAITILTSLDQGDLDTLGLGRPQQAVERLAGLALQAGCQALVCSPLEAARLRSLAGPGVTLVCPGVRPAAGGSATGVAADDQARVAAPGAALAAGADLLVVGRPITTAPDPAAAASAINAEALQARPVL